MSPNDPLLLRLRKHVHHSAIALRPISFGEAMHQANIEIVRSQFLSEAIQIGSRRRRVARPRFGQHRNPIALYMLQRFRHMQPMVISIEQ